MKKENSSLRQFKDLGIYAGTIVVLLICGLTLFPATFWVLGNITGLVFTFRIFALLSLISSTLMIYFICREK